MKLKKIKAIAAVFALAGICVSCSLPSGVVVRSSPELRLPLGWVLGSRGTEMGKMTSKFLNADTIKENLGSDMAVDVLNLKGTINIDGTDYNGVYAEPDNNGVQTYVIKYKGFTGDISGMFKEFDLDAALNPYGSHSEIIQPPAGAGPINIEIELPQDLKTWVTAIQNARFIIKCTYESAAKAALYANQTGKVKFGTNGSASDSSASASLDPQDNTTVIFTSPPYTINQNDTCAVSFNMDPLERYKVALDLEWVSASVSVPATPEKVGDLDFTGMLDQLQGIEFVAAAAYLFIDSPAGTFGANDEAGMKVWVGDSSGQGSYLVGNSGAYEPVATDKPEMDNADWQKGGDITPDASFDIPSASILNLLKSKGSLYYQFGNATTVTIQKNGAGGKFSFSIAIVLPLSFTIPDTKPLVTIGSNHYRRVELEELNNFKSDFDLNKMLGDYGKLQKAEFIIEDIKNDSLPKNFAVSLIDSGGEYKTPIIIDPTLTQEQKFTLYDITEIPEFVFIVPCDGNQADAPATFSIPPVNPDPGFTPQFDLRLAISAKAQVEYEL
jgi:hypothetical protein